MLRSFAIRTGDKLLQQWDLLLTDTRIATMKGGETPYGIIDDGAIAIVDGRIAWTGSRRDLPEHAASDTRSLANKWITPALIDCHTHLVFAGDRAKEFEQRLNGASYAEIAASGGGHHVYSQCDAKYDLYQFTRTNQKALGDFASRRLWNG